ncbi:DUF4055 domain-containing protein [Phocoenobacter skyensis]|uniref:DUF4055 domain-containing protein n=1 Tax=Phocoenobacter skyensis TaxID=97481 RepID=A0ABT9JIC0_9PAST|nr:DUF4055 domain-containing protein [Pasteurella skyensis]MDP8078346.1 DUF4055 domain-containing protein [Pasteurella skyensis]MDP8084562.1 DUF4055 domain-containing protein [Pasteurella skyensis]
MSKVNTKRKEYSEILQKWKLLNDVCSAGDGAIKKGRTTYLPKPNPSDKSEENNARYEQYLARAVFYNATGRTLRGSVGLAFNKYPTLTLPTTLEYLQTDCDGAGVSIYQQSQKALTQVLKLGRHCLFVDYPKTNGEVSIAQKKQAYLRPHIVSIGAEQVINWRAEKVGGVTKLTLVVIQETKETHENFAIVSDIQYRVLSLEGGKYRVRIFDKDCEPTSEDYYPTDATGSNWDIIPFTFIGSENNDADIDEPPLLDLANLNLAHYRNSADYEDSVFFNGQAQPFISGLSEEWRDHLEDKKIYAGSRSVMLLPEGGNYGYAQPQPNTLVKEAMVTKETQMIALGAKLIERSTSVKTATQVNSEDSASHSVLSLCANNVSDAYRLALSWCCRYEGVLFECDYEISQEYTDNKLDPQLLMALVGAWQQGAIPQSQLLRNLRQFDMIDPELTNDDLISELESESNLGLDNE